MEDIQHSSPPPPDDGGLIFDIQRFALHDGPGIRTLVYMKGCPLRCEWCSNPESQRAAPELMFFEQQCLDCGRCLQVCPHGDVLRERWPLAPEVCLACGRCVEACYAGARRLAGRRVTVGEVLEAVLRDRVFYEQSGGGVTVGGGEPTFQARFVAGLLAACRASGLHTAVETCGHARWEILSALLAHTDLLLLDLKHMDSAVHQARTGVGNERILENARRAARGGARMVIRVPLIPGFNEGEENLRRLGRFVRDELPGVTRVDLLPYHSTGESKQHRLGRDYALKGAALLGREEVSRAAETLRSYGLDVQAGD